MDLTQDFADSGFMITGYQPGCVLINGNPYSRSLIVCPDKLITAWGVSHVQRLDKPSLAAIFDLQPEIVLIGTGEQVIFPDGEIIAWFAQQKVGLEAMSTTAACRTYGILISEGRRVAAGLIFPDQE